VQVEQSLKYSQAESEAMWAAAGLKEVGKWEATKEQYSKSVPNLLSPAYSMLPEPYQKFLVLISSPRYIILLNCLFPNLLSQIFAFNPPEKL
jgi:hypothetical protein